MNKELLLKVADAIEANPEHFDMFTWFDKSHCGTTACIAGWAFHIDKGYKKLGTSKNAFYRTQSLNKTLKELLGIPAKDLRSLVYVEGWLRRDLAEAYECAETPEQRARAAAHYVHWFVEQHELSNEFIRP